MTEFPDYARPYVELVTGDDALAVLRAQIAETVSLIEPIGEARAATLRYAPGKWTVKDIIGHVSDAERIFAYRALCIARGDTRPLAGFDENRYAEHGQFTRRGLEDLLQELRAVRQASLALFASFDEETWRRQGVANGYPVTVRGLAFVAAGHERHHVKILRERYLGA